MKALSAVMMVAALSVGTLAANSTKPVLKLNGSVLDYASTKENPLGIPGVGVSILDDKGRLLAEAQTNAVGGYTAELDAGASSLTIHYKKVGYLKNPHIWRGNKKALLPAVYMMRKDQDASYYEKVAKAIRARANIEPSQERKESWFDSLFREKVGSVGSLRMLTETERKGLDQEWKSFRDLSPSPEQKKIVIENFGKEVGPMFGYTLRTLDAKIVASQLASLDSESATNLTEKEGFLKDLLFHGDQIDLGPINETDMLDVALLLQDAPSFSLVIEGHADDAGTADYNRTLSRRRALAAQSFLLEHGISRDRLTIVPVGKERPACVQKTEACRAKNRRISFALVRR